MPRARFAHPLALALAVAAALGMPALHCVAAPLAPCAAEPFADASPGDAARVFASACGGERTDMRLAMPRPATVASLQTPDALHGITPLRASFDTARTASAALGAMTTVRFAWSARGRGTDPELRTERTALSTSSLWRPGEDWALRLQLGREKTQALRTRGSVAALWQPTKAGVLFAEWIGSPTGTEAHRIGLRWLLVPHRLAIDYAATLRPGATPGEEQRIGLTFGLLR